MRPASFKATLYAGDELVLTETSTMGLYERIARAQYLVALAGIDKVIDDDFVVEAGLLHQAGTTTTWGG